MPVAWPYNVNYVLFNKFRPRELNMQTSGVINGINRTKPRFAPVTFLVRILCFISRENNFSKKRSKNRITQQHSEIRLIHTSAPRACKSTRKSSFSRPARTFSRVDLERLDPRPHPSPLQKPIQQPMLIPCRFPRTLSLPRVPRRYGLRQSRWPGPHIR